MYLVLDLYSYYHAHVHMMDDSPKIKLIVLYFLCKQSYMHAALNKYCIATLINNS